MRRTNNDELDFTKNTMPKTDKNAAELMSEENVLQALRFHRSFPQYSVTPLHQLTHLADYLGLGELYVKDESYRFGLNAFKVLGGSFAMVKYISQKTGIPVDELSYKVLSSKKFKETMGQTTFYSATDGNHGRGVAWAANKLGQKAVIRMPRGSAQTRLNNIRKENADAEILDLNYDECVRYVNDMANKDPNGVMVQDTAWRGYTDIPGWIMQGYGTLSIEADRQMIANGCEYPTHIFIQAGVGSLAGSVAGYFADKYKDHKPVICVVEAGAADCLRRSAERADGKVVRVRGKLDTIMAGLSCGAPCTIGWDILRDTAEGFAGTPDWMSAMGTRIYGVPLHDDPQITSGESGSVTMGFLYSIMMYKRFEPIRKYLRLNKKSRVLLVSTEGNTDPVRFREVVWTGLYGIRHRGEELIK